ncbi:hypothetical protein ACRYI5_11025 [Furfurilactobacillus sp. WILCCON 0119]
MPQAQSHDQQITDFWNAVCQCKHLGTLPQPEAWAFGNGEQQADELAALVIAGQKDGDNICVLSR